MLAKVLLSVQLIASLGVKHCLYWTAAPQIQLGLEHPDSHQVHSIARVVLWEMHRYPMHILCAH
jgi:hypothetical protein